ncbi:MAG: hypothetical protein PHV28_03035 [Kiritimatiellae bacterium]|nr:hypothetical protein [Kiritimatiellia bacterium]
MRYTIGVLLVTLCWSCSAGPVWHVAMTTGKAGQMLTVSNGVLSVTVSEKVSWTIREIRSGGTLLVGAFGANGAVASVKTAARLPEAKDGWMGTGHGFETVSGYTVALDGKPVELKPGETAGAQVVTLTKASNIGPLDQVAVIRFPETGDRMIEATRFTANRTLADSLNFVYAYMHCNDNALTEWRAWLDQEKTLDGACVKDDQSYGLQKEVRAVALFAPGAGKGLVYVYPEVYPGDPKGNFFWDRKRDNKLYFRPKIPGAIGLKDDTCAYQLTVMPFSTVSEDWREKAGEIVASLIGKE